MTTASFGASWMKSVQKVLVLCPHTDDELGCAGLIYRLIQIGAEVHYLALSRCEASVPAGYAEDTLELECREATRLLGLSPERVSVKRFAVRYFPEHRQEILELFVKLNREIAPNLVLLPSSFDNHQDHAVVAKEGFRAFKHASVLGYELPQNLISFSNTAFVKLSEDDIQKKIVALAAYKSQGFRPYTSADFIRSLAKVRGCQGNADYAEAYEVVRLIL